jgi:iron complex transport system substrate-binding protein
VIFCAATANEEDAVGALARAGLTVYVSRPRSLEDVFNDLRGIGAAVGHDAEADRLVAALQKDMRAIEARARALPRTRTLVVVWPEPLIVAGRGSHVDDLIAWAGGANVAADPGPAFPSYSVERVVARAPEVVLVGSHKDGAPPLGAFARLDLPAVRAKRLHLVDGDLLFRPGPRLGEGLRRLFDLLHPEAVK